MEGAGMRPLFIYIIRCNPAKSMRKKGKTKFSKEINGQKMKKSKEKIVLRYVLLNENFIQIK
jgi:hypothetical protein